MKNLSKIFQVSAMVIRVNRARKIQAFETASIIEARSHIVIKTPEGC